MKRFVQMFLSPDAALPRWWIIGVAGVVIASVPLFWTAALKHGAKFNLDHESNDQMVYVHMAQNLKESNYRYVVPRMRMPLYAVYLSLFDVDGRTDEEAFAVATKANVLLSIMCVAALAVIFRVWLGGGLALIAALLSGFTWFIEKAGYVQPEVLLATLIGLSCAMLAELLRKPVWWKGMIGGLLLASWHMTKASGPVILAIFFFAWTVKLAWPGTVKRRALLAAAGVLAVSFLLPILPYTLTTLRIFGSPFYNTQSKFFVWCENEKDKHAVQITNVEKRRPTPEELAALPSAGKYLATHSGGDIWRRVSLGYGGMMRRAGRQHPEILKVVDVCALLLLAASLIWWRKAWALVKERVAEIILVTTVLMAFGLLFSWLHQLKVGPRMILSMHLVPLFFSLLWLKELLRGETWTVRGVTLSVERLLTGCVLLPLLLWQAWVVATTRMTAQYFGA